MLFVPSFWWHEVASSPGPVRHHVTEKGDRSPSSPAESGQYCDKSEADDTVQLNVAVNYWFDPLFLKEYPCATCKKYVNKKYASILLEKYGGVTHHST